MDPRLLDYYDRELRHLAGMCGEFARAYPKIAGRLSLEGFIKEFQCPDPYVERLLEGFAYMAARVQLKVDAEYPRFTQALLDMVYPDYLAPVPSMGIVQFQPDLRQGSLNAGVEIGRGAALRSLLGKDDQTACEYSTGHSVTLWPLSIRAADYLPSPAALAAVGLASSPGKAALRLRLASTAGAPFSSLPLDRLVFHVCGNDQAAMRLYEQVHANALAIFCRPVAAEEAWRREPQAQVEVVGFGDDEALLPQGPRSFQGYRLLKEYFSFPPRFMFFGLSGLRPSLQRCNASEIELLVVFETAVPLLQEAIDVSRLALFCAPVVNLFPRRTDRIHLNDASNEFHIVVDRSRPMDFEVYAVASVQGFGAGIEPEVEFLPFYSSAVPQGRGGEPAAYYTLFRTPRVLSSRQQVYGTRSSYVGSEVFLSLVDPTEAPYSSSLRQIGICALCTNRDLPLQMPVGQGRTDLTWDIAAPLSSIRFFAGPTEPRATTAHKDVAWKLISHLSLNYLSLTDTGSDEGAAALRELLNLYASLGDPAVARQVEGVRSVSAQTVARRLPIPGPVSFGRGLQISLRFDEAPFAGTGVFLLAAVLERFFARYVTINAFTECTLSTNSRGEIRTWPPRIGQRYLA